MLPSLAVYLKKRNLFPSLLIIGHPKSSLRKEEDGTMLSEEGPECLFPFVRPWDEAADPFIFPKLWVSLLIEGDICYLNHPWIIYEFLRFWRIQLLIFELCKESGELPWLPGERIRTVGEAGVLPLFSYSSTGWFSTYLLNVFHLPVPTQHSACSPRISLPESPVNWT